LRHRNYRLFFSGQIISFVGTWMHNTAQGWLVYDLTGSSAWLGVVGFLSFLPFSIFALWGGSIADRHDKRRLILLVQLLSLTVAFVYALLVWLHVITIYLIAMLAFTLGVANAFDTPARQAFVVELVGKEDLSNGIALNSAMFNAARLLGPACAGVVIARLGVAWCLFANALSFVPAVVTLLLIRTTKVNAANGTAPRFWHAVREILFYIRSNKTILGLLVLVGSTTIFGWSFVVVLPVFAKDILGGGAVQLGQLLSASGLGALTSAIAIASLAHHFLPRRLVFTGLVIFIGALATFALSRVFWLSLLAIGLMGFGLIMFYVNCNNTLQQRTPDHLRGRIMGLYVMCFGGLMPVGSLQTGLAAEHFSAPTALLFNAAVCATATLAALRFVAQKR
jgi:MFS family permease